MTEAIIALTMITFIFLSCMTLECIMRYGLWSPWAVFLWCLTIGFAWLLVADVVSQAFDYFALSQAPLRSGVFRFLVYLGALQWLLREPRKWARG